ncbi:MAG: DUF4105 domain-containing protein [Candidatus Pacebacteria bacterium]|nr:DUF4105 domain-containing protein [Candidatus Paceibacterota bacterium]
MSVQETGTGLQMRSRAESWTKTVIFILYFCAHLGNATAEPLATPHTTSEEAPRIALTTILPGRSLYSAFGHSAIRVSYPNGGPDLLYNYGLSAKPFDLRFALGMLVGNMPFMAARLRTADAYEFYSQVEDRTIVEQVLAFGREETTAIIAALEEDVRPDRNTYNYRFFTENCATRLWDRLGVQLIPASQRGSGVLDGTMRDHLRRALIDRPWPALGIDLLLGPTAERSGLEVGPFLPEHLRNLTAASVIADAGGSRSAVTETITVYTSRKSAESPYTPAPWIIILIVGALAIIASFFPSSWLAGVFDVGLFSASFLGAVTICAFWLLAGYSETAWNLNLLWLNPLALVALILAGRKGAIPASRIFLAVAIMSLVIVVGGGLGMQEIGIEARILAATIALRCLIRSRFLPVLGNVPTRP